MERQTAQRLRPSDDVVRVARALGYALETGEPAEWQTAVDAMRASLSPLQVAMLAGCAARCLSPESAAAVCAGAMEDAPRAGLPIVSWPERLREDARFWASLASRDELRAYASAILREMTDADRAAVARAASTPRPHTKERPHA